jgi:hypothetical protein
LIGDGGYVIDQEIKSAILDKGAVGTTIFADGKFLRWYNHDGSLLLGQTFIPRVQIQTTVHSKEKDEHQKTPVEILVLI